MWQLPAKSSPAAKTNQAFLLFRPARPPQAAGFFNLTPPEPCRSVPDTAVRPPVAHGRRLGRSVLEPWCMAAQHGNGVWKWISASLFSCLTGGAVVVWMLGTDAVGSADFKVLQSTVNELVVAQAVTSTELKLLRQSIEGHTP